MKAIYLANAILVALVLAIARLATAQSTDAIISTGTSVGKNVVSAGKISVVSIFDYPKQNANTYPEGINDNDDIVGSLIIAQHFALPRGFLLKRSGRFSTPLLYPGSGNATQAWGLNNAPTICGDYEDTAGVYHGMFLSSDGVYSSYDVPNGVDTYVSGINDAGDFCGSFDTSTSASGFVSISGVVTAIDIRTAAFSNAYAINNSGTVVGTYYDAVGLTHGFLRDSSGNITAPIDVPGSNYTDLRGINDANEIVGRYYNKRGQQFGVLIRLPGTFIPFTYAGATQTALNGINNHELMCGYYTDPSSITHGVTARLQ